MGKNQQHALAVDLEAQLGLQPFSRKKPDNEA
jgi:hypothetical protein